MSRHLLLDYLRRHAAAAKDRSLLDGKPSSAGVGEPVIYDPSLTALETREWVRWLVAGLTPMEQHLLLSIYWEGKSLQSIAAEWGSYRAVVQAHYRTLEKLRGRLREG
jgi:DNA-directed RNA polymerase specialized sigma24 family protein